MLASGRSSVTKEEMEVAALPAARPGQEPSFAFVIAFGASTRLMTAHSLQRRSTDAISIPRLRDRSALTSERRSGTSLKD